MAAAAGPMPAGGAPPGQGPQISCFDPSKKHSEIERWATIFPAYLDKKKTVAEGRKIPKEKAVENPNYVEIVEVLKAKGFQVAVQNKMYPRDPNRDRNVRGRIRFQMKNDDGTPVQVEYPKKDAVMVMIADLIPKLKSRTNNPSGAAASGEAGAAGGAGGGGGGKKGKKGKKGR